MLPPSSLGPHLSVIPGKHRRAKKRRSRVEQVNGGRERERMSVFQCIWDEGLHETVNRGRFATASQEASASHISRVNFNSARTLVSLFPVPTTFPQLSLGCYNENIRIRVV